MFIIKHCYEIEDSVGYDCPQEEIVGYTNTEAEAKAFCELWDETRVYDEPYGDTELHCGTLEYEEVKELLLCINPWKGSRWEKKLKMGKEVED